MKIWHGIALASFLSISGIYLLTYDKKTTITPIAKDASKEHVLINQRYLDNIDDGKSATEINLKNPNLPQEVKQFLQYEDLQNSVTSYFENHSSLPKEEKATTANAIYANINNLETRNEIIPIEALSLKLALLKTTTEESEYPVLAKKLTEEYQKKISAEKPEIDYNKNAIYKQREREVLREVQAMSQYPDGMSQSEYLRHRLQLLRTEVFEGSD